MSEKHIIIACWSPIDMATDQTMSLIYLRIKTEPNANKYSTKIISTIYLLPTFQTTSVC